MPTQRHPPWTPVLLQRFDLWRKSRRQSDGTAPTRPHFGHPDVEAFFEAQLDQCSCLIEFGAGGSTYVAARKDKPFVTVESDESFLHILRDRIKADGYLKQDRQHFLYRPIGSTRRWGRPLILAPLDADRRKQFMAFSDFPNDLSTLMSAPLVLVDGRFRAACALKSIKALEGQNFTILVDDYRSRSTYRLIEKFATLEQMQHRMAVFKPKQFDRAALDQAISLVELDWR